MITAIILAGGKGKRMKADVSKQYINLNDKPILYYTIDKFKKNNLIEKIILVISKDEIEYCKRNVLDAYNIEVDLIVEGGSERQDSVFNALSKSVGSDIVLIHDGARPFVSQRIINDAIKYAKCYGAAAPGVMPKDTIKVKGKDNFSLETLKRDELVAVQTPQAFNFEKIYKYHKIIKEKEMQVTDDTMVMDHFGEKVFLYEGDYTNIKITTPEDLILAEYLVRA